MNFKFRNILLFFALSSIVMFSSCGGGEDDLGGGSGSGNSGGTNTPSATVNPYTARTEVPELKKENKFIQHSTKVGNDSVMTYCLEYDPSAFHSRWVAFRFDNTTKEKSVDRSDEPFEDDPILPNSLKIGKAGFSDTYVDFHNISHKQGESSKNYFSRGHLCASADRVYSREANVQTFYMTNMSPQTATFNSGVWLSLEGKVYGLGRNINTSDTLYVVKGGTIDKDNIWGHILRTNGAKVALPKYYFMALLLYKNGQYKSIGFLVEHDITKLYPNSGNVKNEELKNLVVTIDELEKFTGINFFHNLPDAIENSVESTTNPADWGL